MASTRTAGSSGDVALGFALLLPAALLLWPDVLMHTPVPASMAIGVTVLALLPAAVLLLFQAPSSLPRPVWILGLIVTWATVRSLDAGDSFEARRVMLSLWSALTLVLGGLSLGPLGRTILRTGIVLASLLALGQAAWLATPGGLLGNSGDLSEAALPGALLGIACFAEARPRAGWLGAILVLAFAVHAALVPVWTGALALAIAALAPLVLSGVQPALGRYGRTGLLATLFLVLATAMGRGMLEAPSTQAPPGLSETDDGSLRGFEVRKKLWAQVPMILADHTWLGLGSGQFQREFPPYRDPAEIELSSHQRREPTPIEVEHLHNDWLQGLADWGLVAGGLWVLFLAGLGLRAIRTLLGPEVDRRGAALATIAVLVAAAGNSILLEPVASHLFAFPLFGLLLAHDRPGTRGPGPGKFVVPAALLAVMAWNSKAALDFVRHGQALATLASAPLVQTAQGQRIDGAAVLRACDQALAATPDSSIALQRRSTIPQRTQAQRTADLDQYLALRPHTRGVLTNRAIAHAVIGEYESATENLQAALELDPRQPAAISGQIRVAARSGQSERLAAALKRLDEAGFSPQVAQRDALDPMALRKLGLEVLRRGQFTCAEQLLLRGDSELRVRDPNVCWNRGQLAREQGDRELEDALIAGFRIDSARSQMRDGNPSTAIRSYNQAERFSGRTPEVLIELAAALVADGRLEAAQAKLAEVPAEQRLIARPRPASLAILQGAGLWPSTIQQ